MRSEFSANSLTHTALWPLVAVRIFTGNCLFSDYENVSKEDLALVTLQDQNIVMHFQSRNHHISNSVQYFPSTFEAELADVIPVCYSSVAGCRYLAISTV